MSPLASSVNGGFLFDAPIAVTAQVQLRFIGLGQISANNLGDPMKLLLLGAAAVGSIAATLGFGVPAAQAIDCSKAATAVEKMICADPTAAKADNDMAAAYSALAKHLFAPQKKLLASNQSAWIAERESCTETADTIPAAQAACVIDLTTQRRAFLAGLPAEGPGTTSPLQPVIKHGADDTYLTSLEFPHASTPAEKLLNAELARDFAKAHAATESKEALPLPLH